MHSPSGDSAPVVRRLTADDDLATLTALLHRAYAPLAARGMRFVASWQDVEITERRVACGECWVADAGGRVVATVTLSVPGGPPNERAPALYVRPDVASLGQFAVEPTFQGSGLGARLLARVEQRACELGACWVALDTSEHAHDLHAWYVRRGYRAVGRHDWRPSVNYESVILAKRLATPD